MEDLSHQPQVSMLNEDELASPYVPTQQSPQPQQQPPPQQSLPTLFPRPRSSLTRSRSPQRQSTNITSPTKKFADQRQRMMRYFKNRMTSPAALQTNDETTGIISSGLQRQQKQQGKKIAPLFSRALSPSRGSLRGTNEPSNPSLLPTVVSKSLFTSRDSMNSPIPKRPSTGNLRNLPLLQSSPDHKPTNT